MEQVRNRRLDNLCEAIGEHRAEKNAAIQREQADIQASLQEMQRANVTTYRHAGVELARVPGAEKLRVRLTKEEGNAGDEDLVRNDAVDDERREAVEGMTDDDLGGD